MIATCFFHTELEYIWGQHAKLLHTVHHMSNHFHLLHLLTFPATRIYNHIHVWTFLNMLGNACVITDYQHCLCVPVHVSIKYCVDIFLSCKIRCLKQQCMVNKSILR